jgi:pyrroline-5-carboxylate reductase
VNVVIAACNPERLEKAVADIQSLPILGAKIISISADFTQAESIEEQNFSISWMLDYSKY